MPCLSSRFSRLSKATLLFSLSCISLVAFAPQARSATRDQDGVTPVVNASLQAQLAAYLAKAAPKGVDISVTLVDVPTGQVLAEVEGQRPMAPASNLKLVTSAAALDVLGPDFNFETLLLSRPAAAGASDRRPALVVVGDGDPAFFDVKTLAAAKLTPEQVVGAWIEAAQKASPAGFREIIVDDRVFDTQGVPEGWPKNQLDRAYEVAVSGLNFHNNVFAVTPRPNKAGGVDVDVFPLGDFITVQNTARASRDRKSQQFIVARSGNTLKIAGVVPFEPDEPFLPTLPDPALNFGQWLAGKLAAQKMPTGPVRRAAGDEPKIGAGDVVIHKIQTPIQAVLNRTNRDSYNLYAECMLKRLAVKATGYQGSFDGGCKAVRQAMGKRLGEGALAGYHQIDGCGLSKGNRVTTRMMAQLVASVLRDPKIAAAYRTSLARPGMEGSTFEHRFQKVKLAGEVYGKSGYINGVSALAGVLVREKEGKAVAFSILCNATGPKVEFRNADMKRIQEEVVRILDSEME